MVYAIYKYSYAPFLVTLLTAMLAGGILGHLATMQTPDCPLNVWKVSAMGGLLIIALYTELYMAEVFWFGFMRVALSTLLWFMYGLICWVLIDLIGSSPPLETERLWSGFGVCVGLSITTRLMVACRPIT